MRDMQQKGRAGFTLVELLLVIVILGILGGVVVSRIGGSADKAKKQATLTQIGSFATALERYKLDKGSYPEDDPGLAALSDPTAEEQYLNRLPADPWGNAYLYASNSSHGNFDFDVWSVGPDGQDGTEDDIGNWEKEK